jgi:hypothetical protein
MDKIEVLIEDIKTNGGSATTDREFLDRFRTLIQQWRYTLESNPSDEDINKMWETIVKFGNMGVRKVAENVAHLAERAGDTELARHASQIATEFVQIGLDVAREKWYVRDLYDAPLPTGPEQVADEMDDPGGLDPDGDSPGLGGDDDFEDEDEPPLTL